jgi:hypothetical protein
MNVSALTQWLWSPAADLASAPPRRLPAQTFPALGSALLSLSLAEAIMAGSSARELGWVLLSYLLLFCMVLWLFSRLSGLASRAAAPWQGWLVVGTYALFPVHLLLPAALAFRPAGVSGLFLYELVKIGVILSAARRFTEGVEAVNGWPRWAALILLMSPWLLACLGLVFMLFVALAAGVLLLSGAAA